MSDTDSGILIRKMNDADLERILELRSVVRWSADPRAFDLLRGVRDARWAVAEAPDGDLAGMVGAVPLGEIGILCHLAVHDGYRGFGLGALLSSWAVTYLRSRGAKTSGSTRHERPRASTVRSVSRRSRRAPFTGWKRGPGDSACPISRRSQGRDAHVRGPARALRRGPLELRGRPFGPALRHPEASSRTRPRRPRLVGRNEGLPDPERQGRATRIGPFLASTPDVARLLLARALSATGVRRSRSRSPVRPNASPTLSCENSASRAQGPATDGAGREEGQPQGSCTTARHRTGLVHYGTTPYLPT